MNTYTIETVAALVKASLASDDRVKGQLVDAGCRLTAAAMGAYDLVSIQGAKNQDVAKAAEISAPSMLHFVEVGHFLSLTGTYEPEGAWSVAHAIKTLIANACKVAGVPTVRKAITDAKDQPAAAKAIASLAKAAKAAKAETAATTEGDESTTEPTTVVVDDFTAALAKAADAIKAALANAPLAWSDADRANVQQVTDLAALLAMASVKVEVTV